MPAYLWTRFPRQHGLEDASITVVRVDVYVHDAPWRAFVAEQIAPINGF